MWTIIVHVILGRSSVWHILGESQETTWARLSMRINFFACCVCGTLAALMKCLFADDNMTTKASILF
jgi:hypothetical protein